MVAILGANCFRKKREDAMLVNRVGKEANLAISEEFASKFRRSSVDVASSSGDAYVPVVKQPNSLHKDAFSRHLTDARAPLPPARDVAASIAHPNSPIEFEPIEEAKLWKDFKAFASRPLAQGHVKVVQYREGGQAYAMKTVPQTRFEAFQREVRLQKLVESDHIVKLYKSFIKPNGDGVILTELLPDGELDQKFLLPGGRLDWNMRQTMRQIIDGVKVCHDHDVVHLDLKPANIWCKGKDVKIGDFGFAMETNGEDQLSVGRGTEDYLPPEFARNWLDGTAIETPLKKADIWSLGVTFYVLLTGHLPWSYDKLDERTRSMNMRGFDDVYVPLPWSVDRDADDLIKNMLQVDPLKRYTIEQVASHKYFAKPSLLGQMAKDVRASFGVVEENYHEEFRSLLAQQGTKRRGFVED
jgi:serine/threonine protein kinase